MSFQDNKFAIILGGITLLAAGGLYFYGSQGASRYEAATAKYQEDYDRGTGFEKLPLYPSVDNVNAKRTAIATYRESVVELQKSFAPFQPAFPLPTISPQEFTDRLKATDTEVKAAFQAKGATLPEGFFSGFESYANSLARQDATGILGYELETTKDLLLSLANAGPNSVITFLRGRVSEEDGKPWVKGPKDVARPLPFELSFRGPEKAARDFITSISNPSKHYYVIRTVRIASSKATPPLSSDAQFDALPAPDAAAPSDGGASAFVLPGDPATPAAPAAEPEPAPAAVADSGRMLSQVLGTELVDVFIRLDAMLFLPAEKELPTP